jgi:hypothetical protein
MPSRESAKAAAPIGASDPRHVDQLGRQIGAEASPSKPSPQAIGLRRLTVRSERMRRVFGWHDIADLEVEGHA